MAHSQGFCLAAAATRPFPTVGSSLPLQARRQFQSQLADLQQLPDILKITEAKLAECQDQLQGYERKNIDLTAIISDLRSRVRDWQKGSHELAQAGPAYQDELHIPQGSITSSSLAAAFSKECCEMKVWCAPRKKQKPCGIVTLFLQKSPTVILICDSLEVRITQQ